MLVNFLEQACKVDNLAIPQKGIVMDNQDPKKLGRVKCMVRGLIEGETRYLPWCYPKNPYGLGGGGNEQPYNSSFSVPEVGTELEITFPYGDIYHPMYSCFWQSAETHQTGFDSDYPESYGFRDSTGNYIKVNKAQGYMKVKHGPSGSYFDIDRNGNVTIHVSGQLRIDVEKDIILSGRGAWTWYTDKNLKIDAARIDLNKDHARIGEPNEPYRAIE